MELTILELQGERHWSGNYGPMICTGAKYRCANGNEIIGEWNRKSTSPPPDIKVGDIIEAEVKGPKQLPSGDEVYNIKVDTRDYKRGHSGNGEATNGTAPVGYTPSPEAKAQGAGWTVDDAEAFLAGTTCRLYQKLREVLGDEAGSSITLEKSATMATTIFLALKDGFVTGAPSREDDIPF